MARKKARTRTSIYLVDLLPGSGQDDKFLSVILPILLSEV